MTLAQVLSDAVDQIFAALDDVAATVTYVKCVQGAYDVAADSYFESETNVTMAGVLYSGKDLEMDSTWRLTSAQNKSTDTNETRLLIAASSLPGYKPKNTDYMLIEGERWSIYGIEPLPSNPAWILMVRKP